MEDLTGKQLGQYQLVAPLGEGGMAVVYKAYQPSMERYVALKILPRYYATDPDFVRRFKQEAKIIASLEHPNILPVYDYGEADGYTYIVMRYVEGKTFTDLLEGQPLPLSQCYEIISKVASALDYAHSRGVVHRDVKPSNVLIDQQGNLLLSDFGLAKMFISSLKFTTSGAFLGTPTYASPEQCLGRRDLDGRSDVYSLGVMLYEMATGRPPFDAETPMAVVIKHISDPLPLPRKINPTLLESVERVILKTLAKEREGRYPTTGEMIKALAGAITQAGKETTTVASPKSESPATSVVAKRRSIPRWGWALGGLAMLGMLAIAIGLAKTTTVAQPPTKEAIPSPVTTPTKKPTLTVTQPPSATTVPGQLSTTPELPPITLLREFKSPGSPYGIAWKGKNLWVSQGAFTDSIMLLQLDEAGNTTGVFISNIMMIWNASIAWADDSLWLFENNGIHELKIEGSQVIEAGQYPPISSVQELPFTTYAITWDGQNLWLAQDNYVFQMDPSGTLLANFVYPTTVAGLAWDGTCLWIGTGSTLDAVDGNGKTLASFTSPISHMSSLAWDGTYLWTLGDDKIYQLDIAQAQAYVGEQARLLAQTPALFEVLRLIPSEEGETRPVQIINNTERVLRVSFEEYNYTEQIEPGGTKVLTPPGNSFVAEVPDLPPLRGQWYFEPRAGYVYAWTFSVREPSALLSVASTPTPTAAPNPIPGLPGLAVDAVWPMINGGLTHWSRLPFAGPAHPEFTEQSGFYQIGFWPGAAIAADGTRYTTSEGSHASITAMAVDGSGKWNVDLEDRGLMMGWVMGAINPAIDSDGTIYVGCPVGRLLAIAPNGTVKWRFTTGEGVGSSAAIGDDGTIYFGGSDGVVYAVNPNGTLKWKYSGLDYVASSPALDENGTIYIGAEDSCLYAFTPQGDFKWKFTGTGPIRSSPLITEQGIYFGARDGFLYAVTPNGNLRWSLAIGDHMDGSPALGLDGTLYVLSPEPALLAISQEGKILWTYRSSNIQDPSEDSDAEGATPRVDVYGTIYIPCRDPDVCAIDPEGKFLGYFRPAEK